ncbi:MAG: GspE/PulE family protein [Candidatus Gracilibacteria bacterium]|nr:GspE/PulE family protein [Candidatus Gracilibacteria bacterium]
MSLKDILNKGVINKVGINYKNVNDLFNIPSSTPSPTIKKSNIDSDLNINPNSNNLDETFIIGYINDIILNAMQLDASDIHIEPTENILKVRFRVDGNFIKYKEFPKTDKESFIARIKIMAYLRIDEHRLPQDGKINYKLFAGKSSDLRVSIIPTIYGEKCVIRILKKDSKPPQLKELGIQPYNMVKIKKHIRDSYGMILAVGPTGSGKSTTLFSLLSQFNAEENNISTLEDPVEYRIPGVNHTQINPAINFSFANGLRSLLRQDPDIIMVGEIRDEETAKLAVEASITGHIVFSTLHTNSAVHTIQRLVNLGIDPLLITSSLRIIVSQRLGRRLCPICKEKYTPDSGKKQYILGKIGKYIKNKDNFSLYRANENGCDKCNNTGYKGRVGFFELLEITDSIEELILKQVNKNDIEKQAIKDGMFPILEDALIKVFLGETSIEEVLYVIGN